MHQRLFFILTDLGLAISYGIVNGHNGRIQAAGEEGKGTEFTIDLPPGSEPAMNSVEKRLRATVNRGSDRFFDSQPLNLAPQGVFVYPQFAGCGDLSPPVALQGCLNGALLEWPESGV